jgi:predicted ThiF/HesA family dinucleotide-utilizing enzyme
MTDTPDSEHISALAEERDAFRSALVKRGFSDDGTSLQGTIFWEDEHHESHSARIEVVLTERFPFAPPSVTILEAHPGFTPTFHIEQDGKLCLWPNDVPVDDAPWRDPEQFLEKVRGWFAQTSMGWPGDEDADLERYLDANVERIVLYDDSLLERNAYFRTSENQLGVVTVSDRLLWPPNAERMKNRGARRREKRLLWVLDVGLVSRPIRTWQDLREASGQDLEMVRSLIAAGSLRYILVRYQRGGRHAALVLDFPGPVGNSQTLRACESADQSTDTRTLRAGPAARKYSDKKVVVVGCGAVGSHVADLLFRSGVRRMTLIDPERLRPGNVIRHAADNQFAGTPKTSAVKARLAATGLAVDQVEADDSRIGNPDDVLELVRAHDLVVDATGDARATALLRWATEAQGGKMISVCVQRGGGIARVDRFPLRAAESHVDPVPLVLGQGVLQERGCGSPVSITPPVSVIKAATTACQVALDQLDGTLVLPSTILEVIEPQADPPYNFIGTITS